MGNHNRFLKGFRLISFDAKIKIKRFRLFTNVSEGEKDL